jgi:hypothetical protein
VLEEVPEPVLVCDNVGGGVELADNEFVDDEVAVADDDGVPLAEPPIDKVVVGVAVTVVERLIVGDPLSLPDGVCDGVREPEPVPDSVGVGEPVGVEDSVAVVDPVREFDPEIEELAPNVTEAVGVRDTDGERLIVGLPVIDGVPEEVLEGVLVGVPLAVTLAVTLEVSEMLGVTLALAPNVTLGVAEFESDALSEDVDEGVDDGVSVPELVRVPVGVALAVLLAVTLEDSEILGVTLALAPNVTEGVAEFDSDALRVDEDEGVSDEVPVLDVVPDPVLVCEGVGIGVTDADCVGDQEPESVPKLEPDAVSVAVSVLAPVA